MHTNSDCDVVWLVGKQTKSYIRKLQRPALRHFGVRLESFRAGVTLSRTTSTIELTSLPCVQPTLLTMDLNLCPCKDQSQELMHINSSRVRGPKTPFCIAFAPTALTFAYEIGLRRCLARSKANEKFQPKVAKSSSTSFRRAFGILPCRTLSRTTSTIDEDITFMRTSNAPHNGSEPVPLHVNHKSACTSILVEFVDRKHRFA